MGLAAKVGGARCGRAAACAQLLPRTVVGRRNSPTTTTSAQLDADKLWVPPGLSIPNVKADFAREGGAQRTQMNSGAPASVSSGGYDEHRAKTPPPDLPSILLDARIIWLGMPIVSAVSELIIAQLLYLQVRPLSPPCPAAVSSLLPLLF